MQQSTTLNQTSPQLSLDVQMGNGPDNGTFTVIMVSNNGSSVISNVKITLNPSHEIISFRKEFVIDDIDLQKGGPLSLIAKMPRLSACSKVVISTITKGTLEDTDYAVYVTSDQEKSLVYHSEFDGKKIVDTSIPFKFFEPC